MTETIIRTQDGDMLDAICHRHYGAVSGALETVLAANPHLHPLPPQLPSNIEITLPAITPAPTRRTRLF